LLDAAARQLFSVASEVRLFITPAPTLGRPEVRAALVSTLQSGGVGLVYFQDKLGGEISLSPTSRSPELAFDITLAQIQLDTPSQLPHLVRYAIVEAQTMEFHGTYRYAVKNLEDALRLHRTDFTNAVQANPGWISDRIQGPNTANVFKRMFYQMMMKFQIANHDACAGCAIAIPTAVWDSWQKHLGAPELELQPDGSYVLRANTDAPETRASWILIFDIDADSATVPNPLRIRKVIKTTAESIAHYALRIAPSEALVPGGSADRLLTTIQRRLASWWPQIQLA
jgi:hypothetical protein